MSKSWNKVSVKQLFVDLFSATHVFDVHIIVNTVCALYLCFQCRVVVTDVPTHYIDIETIIR